jgi:GntR family transcriptional regulator
MTSTFCLLRYGLAMVDQLDPTPLKVQLAAVLRAQIESGALEPGKPIPSESYLQQEHGVSRGTVREAVALLREAGLVVTIQGRGTFVT